MRTACVAVLASALCLDAPALAQATGAEIPADRPYPGTIELRVDATDVDHKILKVQERIPVREGTLSLLFPRWLPGDHGPFAEPGRIAGLIVKAGERRLPWARDTADPYLFRIEVPAGVSVVDVEFQHLSPVNEASGRVEFTRNMVNVEWDAEVLYPAGHYASAIRVKPALRLPSGWQQASGMRSPSGELPRADADRWFEYETVSLETLVDSPVFGGRYVKRIDLDAPGTAQPVAIDLFAEEPAQLDISAEQIAAHRALVEQADKLYGARHFRHYDLLLAQSAELGGIGLEHHESSENGVFPGYFKDWDKTIGARDLMPHEYTHSWNGKFRRPADLWTPNYNVPMRNSLLWMYEGQTQYWGRVLTARSGLGTPEQVRDALAYVAAGFEQHAGRSWRNLQDTTNDPAMALGRDKDWGDWQRSVDYYDESALIWLDVDTLIREKTHGAKRLDDFARAFFGVENGRVKPLTYTFDDVVRTLNSVASHDWAQLLRSRLDANDGEHLLDGLKRSGWRLAYTEVESAYAREEDGWGGKYEDFSHSIGLRMGKEGKIDTVVWESPAFHAGMVRGATLLAVNEHAYKSERLAEAITANKQGEHPVELLIRDGDIFHSVRIDYRGGLRYPRLERVEGTSDVLGDILAPRH